MPEEPPEGGPDRPDALGPVQCPICEEEFESPQDLEAHMKEKHS